MGEGSKNFYLAINMRSFLFILFNNKVGEATCKLNFEGEGRWPILPYSNEIICTKTLKIWYVK